MDAHNHALERMFLLKAPVQGRYCALESSAPHTAPDAGCVLQVDRCHLLSPNYNCR